MIQVAVEGEHGDAPFGIPGADFFRTGLLTLSTRRVLGCTLLAVGFLVAAPGWSIRPLCKPLRSVVAGFAAADGLHVMTEG